MSDAITDLYKDKEIIEKIKNVRGLQKKFEEEPSKELAKDIISKLESLKTTSRGYYKAIDVQSVEEDIKKYKDYL